MVQHNVDRFRVCQFCNDIYSAHAQTRSTHNVNDQLNGCTFKIE